MRKILIVLAGALALVVGAVPGAGAAGNWAVTYMDPGPARFEGGESYALGFWVLQHGNHPFEGKMEPVGLRFTRSDGESLTFAGTALPEAAHYATSVVVPEGEWRVHGIQGPFQPYELGTLTVPGSLKIHPVPADMVMPFGPGSQDFWDEVRPPGFEPGGKPGVAAGQVTASAPAVAPRAVAPEERGGGVPAYTLLVAAAGGAVLALGVVRLTARRREESGSPADTVAISG